MVAVAPISVVPRAISPLTGDSVPLRDVVEEFCETHAHGALLILGPAGAGKTTALAYLAGALSHLAGVDWLDQPPMQAALAASMYRRVVLTSASPLEFDGLTVRLAPWTRDELIEFLLAECPDRCESVMRRLRNWDCSAALLPIFWATVLRTLARDDSLRDVRTALQQHLRATVRSPDSQRIVGEYCLAKELTGVPCPANWPAIQDQLARETRAIISLRPVRLMLAAEEVVNRLANGDTQVLRLQSPSGHYVRHLPWPAALLEYVAEQVVARPALLGVLRRALAGHEREHQAAASLVVRVDRCWRPTRKLHRHSLAGADLRGVDWSGLDLSDYDLGAANLSGADLAGATLRNVDFGMANLSGARLPGADLSKLRATEAKLAGAVLDECRAPGAQFLSADLRGVRAQRADLSDAFLGMANLSQAEFRGSTLARARLQGADLSESDLGNCNLARADLVEVDLRTTELSGSCLRQAQLSRVNFEAVDWTDVDFTAADLYHAHCTGSRLRRASLQGASLRHAELGEVDWEGADLRDADLRDATFHLGSSRSGLVFSPFASEGSRTGFYTDESLEQHFQTPEEIRKANLCRVDLRGANIDGVDFYLVDLRGARFDPAQLAHLRSSGAILDPIE